MTLLSARYGKNIYTVTPETLQLFREYSWPGNLRELRNIIERSLINARNDCPLSVNEQLENTSMDVRLPSDSPQPEKAFDLRSAENDRLVETLLQFNGNKAKVARHLGISRGTVYNRLRELEHESYVYHAPEKDRPM